MEDLLSAIRIQNFCRADETSWKKVSTMPEMLQEGPLDLSKSPSCSSQRLRRIQQQNRSLLPCSVCGKCFDRPSLLKRHMRTHTGEKPHVCEVCGKGFSTSSSLNTHRRIHSGEKPHQCLVCGKRFTASSNLYYHRMTHTKEKPHKCNQCSKSFPTPGDLKAHTYTHSGTWPYRCSVCGRGFSKQTNLRNHLFLHTGDRPHPCQLCGKKFALACNLRAHARTHHPVAGAGPGASIGIGRDVVWAPNLLATPLSLAELQALLFMQAANLSALQQACHKQTQATPAGQDGGVVFV